MNGSTTPTPLNSKRRRFANFERLAILRNARRRVEAGESIRAACRALNIIPKQYREWSTTSRAMVEHGNAKAKSTAKGPTSVLAPIENDLLKFIFELREQGFAVSISTVVIQASRLMSEFQRKSSHARYQSVRRLIRKHSLVHRMGTHESQRSPSETAGLAQDYVQTIRPKLAQSNRHEDFILNMDQTPVPFTFNAKRTLESVGLRTIHIRKSTSDTKRVTCAMTVSASGRVLTPLLVFKGAPNGRIERNEFVTYPDDIEYACQSNAWMDERVMHIWIDRILKPYIDQAPPGIVPLLLLDSYRCHMMKSTVNAIEGLGVEVEHIPGGCTSLCQPVDVGVNKPFKSRMRKLWEEWMISTGLHQGKIDPPTRKHIAEWCSVSSQDLPAQMVRNSWRHGMYSYYPVPPVQEEEEHTTDDEVNDFVGNQQNDNPEDDEGGDEYDGSDDDETLRNQSEPLLSYQEDYHPHNQQGEEQQHAADKEVNSVRHQNDIVQQQGSNDDHGSGDDDESVGSDDDDETMRNHSEPLLSYHEVNQQPHGNQHNHRHIDKTYNETLNSIVVGNSCGSTLDESLPPLPDTIQLVRILHEVQQAKRSERHDRQDHSEPLLSNTYQN